MALSLLARIIVGILVTALATLSGHAGEATGAGSTFVFPILAKWADQYQVLTGNRVTYQSIGSGGGIAEIKSASVDFGASDMPIKPEVLKKLGLGQFPLVIGGVVPVYNVDGIAPGQMRFTGPLLADIYIGKIKTWDDPAIQALNPGVKLPSMRIAVVHRSDGSGTTFNWANYLAKVSPEWNEKVGQGYAVEWPIGMGARGNEGVAAFVIQTPGSIGYVEYAYALQNKMSYGLVQNRAGQFVSPGSQSFQQAAASADWASASDFYVVMTDAPGEKAYPITATVFMLMYKQPKDPERARIAMDFFKWAFESGQKQAESLDYVPLPAGLVQQIEAYWQSEFSSAMH